MINKKKKKNIKPIDIKGLADNLNTLTFIQNDFKKIVDKENEVCNNIIDVHSIKKKETLIDKEKIQIILNELISSCEKKKKTLNNYIDVTQNVIKKNDHIIEIEKANIENLISEKNTCIEVLQHKIDSLKEAHSNLNLAIINVFNNLKSFINLITKGKVDIKEVIELTDKNQINQKKYAINSCEYDSESSIQKQSIQTVEHWKKQICDENKIKLLESINDYRAKLKKIKLMINNNVSITNSKADYNKDKNENYTIVNPSVDTLMLEPQSDGNDEKKEKSELLCCENVQETMPLTKDNIVCDTLLKVGNTDIQNIAKQSTNEKGSDEDATPVNEEETNEDTERETDEDTEGETDEDTEGETDEDTEGETDEDTEEETDEDTEGETDEDTEEEIDKDIKETSEDTDEEVKQDGEKKKDNVDYIHTSLNTEKEKKKSSSIKQPMDENVDKSEQESFNIEEPVITNLKKELPEIENYNNNDKKKNFENEILVYDTNQRLFKKKNKMFFEELKNMDFDYLSYFKQKLKNS